MCVWNLTASALHCAATSINFCALPKLPSWTEPISATTYTWDFIAGLSSVGYPDGWIIYTHLADRKWDVLRLIFLESGAPVHFYIHWAVGSLPHFVFAHKVIAFLAIIFAGLFVYHIGNELELLSPIESLAIALISVTYPAFQVAFELVMLPHLLLYSCFLLGVLIALRSERATGRRRVLFRLLALLMFVCGFALNSLLVFYFGFLLVLFLHIRRLHKLSLKQLVPRWLWRRLDYILLPFIFWFVEELLFPKQGIYVEYNQFQWLPYTLVMRTLRFFQNAIFGQFHFALADGIGQPWVWLLMLAAFAVAYKVLPIRSIRFFSDRTSSYTLLGFGLLLLLLGIFPYVSVGKRPTVHGWDTRHALLMALPMAIILLASFRLLNRLGKGMKDVIGLYGVTFLLVIFSLALVANYVSWQARWVKDRSVIVNLARLEGFENISVFWIDDRLAMGGERHYRFFEWSSIFKTVWGGESRIGLQKGIYTTAFLSERRTRFTPRYNLAAFDPAGCQAELVVRRGSADYGEGGLVARYLWYKYVRSDRLHPFLVEVTSLHLKPIIAPEAANCSYRNPN